MKFKHTVKFISGNKEEFVFNTKAESDKRLVNAIQLNKTFNTIRCIWIEPLNKPEQRVRLDLQTN